MARRERLCETLTPRIPLRAVIFDMGGTLEDVYYDDAMRLKATSGFRDILAKNDYPIANILAVEFLFHGQEMRLRLRSIIPANQIHSYKPKLINGDDLVSPQNGEIIVEEFSILGAQRLLKTEIDIDGTEALSNVNEISQSPDDYSDICIVVFGDTISSQCL